MSSKDARSAAVTLGRSPLLHRLGGVRAYELTVRATEQLSPALREVRLGADDLAELEYQPGQDLMVAVPARGGAHFRRRYTIRRLDRRARTLDLDIVVHGDGTSLGPGARWAATTQPGDRVEALGPRGSIVVDPDAGWHLFAGDESALPAMAAMAESLEEGSRALLVLELPGAADEQSLSLRPGVDAAVHWLHRAGPPGTGTALCDALRTLSLPEGRGRAYLAGELETVGAMRHTLLGRGFAKEQLSSKPYWRLGRANAAQEPAADEI